MTEKSLIPSAVNWITVHERLTSLAKNQSNLDFEKGRWLLTAFRLGVHARLGMGTFSEYAIGLFGPQLGSVTERLRVARDLEDLPQLAGALKGGELNWSIVRELTRVVTVETETEWLRAVSGKKCRAIEALVSGLTKGDRPGAPKRRENERHVLRFEVTAETMATFREAMMKLQRETGESMDEETAVLLMARGVLAGPNDEGRAGYQIALTKCPECSRAQQQGQGELVDVASDIAEMAECDAQLIGDPCAVDHGPATQTIPPAIRRQVMRRDHGQCVVPGCRCATFVDLHHVHLRSEGGNHDTDLLVVLCGGHHRAAHRGTLSITGRVSTGLVFEHADGTRYDGPVSPRAAAAHSDAFCAVRDLGFGETETRRALAAVRHDADTRGAPHDTGELIRLTLRRLTPRPAGGSQPAMVRERPTRYETSLSTAPTWDRGRVLRLPRFARSLRTNGFSKHPVHPEEGLFFLSAVRRS